ncbi:hypothetical protein J41TS2_29750 [Bacillus sonorensis]|nr:hypothetical protein J41TS2_29750 [Bacillus sonorensis]
MKEVSNLNPKIRSMLHYLSLTGSFLMVFGVLYLIQKYSIGILFSLNSLYIGMFPIHMGIYTATSIIMITKFFTFSSPYK